uniref:Homeobox domain-containing protein n=1 Tax=Caenorhabditis tropicalis TaxID=1561998 RepID=A0A1I7U9C4_9PELO
MELQHPFPSATNIPTSAFLRLNDRQYFQIIITLQTELSYIISKSLWIRIENAFGQLLDTMLIAIQRLSDKTEELTMFDIIETMLKQDFIKDTEEKLLDTNHECWSNNKSITISDVLLIHEQTQKSEKLIMIPIQYTSQWIKLSLLSALLEKLIFPIKFGRLIQSLVPFSLEKPPRIPSVIRRCRMKRLPKEFYDEVRQLAEIHLASHCGKDEENLTKIMKRFNISRCRVKGYLNQCKRAMRTRKLKTERANEPLEPFSSVIFIQNLQ